MKLLRSILPLVILLASAAYTFAQQQPPPLPTCPLKQVPEFHGFQLGMTLGEVKDNLADASMFDAKIMANKIGAQAVRITGAELKDEHAEGIDDVNLTFVDKRLAVIRATFHSGAGNWFGAKDYFKQISEKLGLPQPSSANSAGSRGGEKYKVDCIGFNVTLAYSFGVSPNVTIANTVAQKLIEERNKENPDEGVSRPAGVTIGTPPRPRRNPPFLPF
ncbi:MAG TPA: hypothetical protein VF766_09645 [Pyrinomonadaceae bacterium]